MAPGSMTLPLADLLLSAAANLGGTQLLMVNVTHDELFPTEGTHRFFDAVPGSQKRLMFWEGSWSPVIVSKVCAGVPTSRGPCTSRPSGADLAS